ncbi:uncharacterized protein DFL_005926 [Arthrobotrys flagrans]|uniref:Uncharacterized protein n=1 Tax=Arthrobotrys flagrans TaxID=97331 RepID=A0A436ZYR5_ARTFL|nr:hypothetical protein DFL_005926 [Arthrobotrys flagrans]
MSHPRRTDIRTSRDISPEPTSGGSCLISLETGKLVGIVGQNLRISTSRKNFKISFIGCTPLPSKRYPSMYFHIANMCFFKAFYIATASTTILILHFN